MKTVEIKTDRLVLRPYTLADAPFIFRLMNSEGWGKNIGDRNIKTIADAETYMEKRYLESYKKHGFGPYLVSLKEDNTPIGSAGLYQRDNLDHPDIGFAFLPEFYHKGYAFEAAHAVMRFAWEPLGIETIVGITLETNLSSIKLLKKLGLSRVGHYIYEDGEELLLFSNKHT